MLKYEYQCEWVPVAAIEMSGCTEGSQGSEGLFTPG